ncbi:unnamed protein product [Urochloa humidicola]
MTRLRSLPASVAAVPAPTARRAVPAWGAGSARHESVPLGGVGGGAAVEAAAMEADGAAAGDGAGGGGSVAGQLETLDSAALTLPLHRDAFTRTAADAAGRALPAVPHRSACPDPRRRLRRPPHAARPRRRLPLLLGRWSRRVKLSAEDAAHIFRNTMGRAEPSEEHLKHTESERMARKMEDLYLNQVQQRKQTEELLSRTKQELERLKIQHVDVTKKLQKANEHNERVLGQLSESRGQYDSLLSEHNHLLHDRDRAVREVEGLRQKRGQMLPVLVTSMYSEFSTSELESASENFSSSLKIGEGGFACVYRGILRNMTVAIKVLKPDSLQGRFLRIWTNALTWIVGNQGLHGAPSIRGKQDRSGRLLAGDRLVDKGGRR